MKTCEAIYETVIGQALQPVAGVNDLFAEGQVCDALYESVYCAADRLSARLGVQGEDADVQILLDSWQKICRLVAYEMFRCGAELGCSINAPGNSCPDSMDL